MKMQTIKLSKLGASADKELTLVPRGVNPTNGVATLAESGAIPAVEKRVTISVSQPSRNRKNYKVAIKASNPAVCTASGKCDPDVARTAYGEIGFTFSAYSTAEERSFLRTQLAAFLATDLAVDAIDNLNPAY